MNVQIHLYEKGSVKELDAEQTLEALQVLLKLPARVVERTAAGRRLDVRYMAFDMVVEVER